MAETLAADTQAEADATPDKTRRRWLLEIKLAEKREKEWRKEATTIIETYRGTKKRANSFNILWSNTEVLRPALYNSTPKPDVRRRWRQSDPLGKAVSEVAERSATYCVDAYDFNAVMKLDVLDALLPGRGISRVRYIPQIKTVPEAQSAQAVQAPATSASPSDGEAAAEGTQEAFEGTHEEVEYEQALCDHVQWDDFLHGPGKIWAEVRWVAFKQKLNKDDLIDKFGSDVADKITLGEASDSEFDGKQESDKEVFKRALLWEIWDKDSGKVFFVSETYMAGVIYPKDTQGEPPLKFKNFFPCPQPLIMVEDSTTTIPTALYSLYEQQAKELDEVSARINKIIKQCRVRFAYDPSLTELSGLMDAKDGDGIPVDQARSWMANGGIEKAIWWMPINMIAAVLKELYAARDQAKEVIYEVTGISDIIRGATDPDETLGAQKLKASTSSMRLQRMQREVQRYVRDLIRLLVEVIGENFNQQTLAAMTGLQFPTDLQKQQIQLQVQAFQQQAQAAQQQGQQLPSPPQLQAAQQGLSMPSWEDILRVMQSDIQREYLVDIETDSTVAESLTQDMQGMKEVITSVVEIFQGLGPAVAQGALTPEAAKSIVMAVVRRARMGTEVEDALEHGIQAPKPQNDPAAAAAQAKQQQDALTEQHQQQMAQAQLAHEQQVAQREQQFEEQKAQLEANLQRERDQNEARMTMIEAKIKDEFDRWEVQQNNDTKIIVAQISAKSSLDQQLAAAEQKADSDFSGDLSNDGSSAAQEGAKTKRIAKPIDRLADMHAQAMEAHGKTLDMLTHAIGTIAAPRETVLVRGPDGRAQKAVSQVVTH